MWHSRWPISKGIQFKKFPSHSNSHPRSTPTFAHFHNFLNQQSSANIYLVILCFSFRPQPEPRISIKPQLQLQLANFSCNEIPFKCFIMMDMWKCQKRGKWENCCFKCWRFHLLNHYNTVHVWNPRRGKNVVQSWTFSHFHIVVSWENHFSISFFSNWIFPRMLMFYFEPFSMFVSICVSVGPDVGPYS